MPVPPRAEQRRIVAKLDELLARSRRAREALAEVPALVARYRESVLAAAFRGDLTADWREANPAAEPASALQERIRVERRRRWEEAELAKLTAKGKAPKDERWKERYEEPIESPSPERDWQLPESWAIGDLDALAWDADYGTSVKCDHNSGGPPVLRIPNIVSGTVLLDDLKFAKPSDEFAFGAELAPGDILFIRTNGSRDIVGRSAVIREAPARDTYFASYLIRMRLVLDDVLWSWVAAWTQAPEARALMFDGAASSAGQHNISLTTLRGIPVPLAPLAEQREIVRRVEAAFARIDAVEAAVAEQRARLDAYDRSLLARAFAGELVPQDPADEPAATLLARLRAERGEAAPARGRRRRG